LHGQLHEDKSGEGGREKITRAVLREKTQYAGLETIPSRKKKGKKRKYKED